MTETRVALITGSSSGIGAGIAQAAVALHLVNAAYTTGDVLTVDGGRHVV